MEISDGPTWKITEPPPQRQQLEHSLATTFTTMQRERVPGKRQELWAECLRLAAELEKLNAGS